MLNILKNNYICANLPKMKEEEYFLSINDELNISGKYLIIDNISFVFFGYSTKINVIDFYKINQHINRFIKINKNPIYNLDNYSEWNNSYSLLKNTNQIFVFKNTDLLYYSLKK